MRVIDLALNDLRQILRDRKAALFLLVMPIVFTILFGFAFSGSSGGGEQDTRLPVGYFSLDQGRFSGHLRELLERSSSVRPVDGTGAEELDRSVKDGNLSIAVVVPAGYSQSLMAGQQPPVEIIADPASAASATAQNEVQAAVRRLSSALAAARAGADVYRERIGFQDAPAEQAYVEAGVERIVAAWSQPPVILAVSGTSAPASSEQQAVGSVFSHTSPGMMAQFAIAGLMSAANVLVLERKKRVLSRLLTTNLSRGQILIGHYLAMFILIVAQLSVLMVFGQIVLGVNYLAAPLASALFAVSTGLFCASLGLLIGALAANEEQAIVFSLIPMFVLAGLGGAWVPLDVMPEGVRQIASLTPVAWIVEGLKDITIRGQGLADVLPGMGVLAGYAVVLFGLAAWRFRFE